MSYFNDVYLRLYDLFCSHGSWALWFFGFLVLGGIVGIIQDSDNQYKKRILYIYIIALVSSFFIRLILWVLLPSPEYLGLIK